MIQGAVEMYNNYIKCVTIVTPLGQTMNVQQNNKSITIELSLETSFKFEVGWARPPKLHF